MYLRKKYLAMPKINDPEIYKPDHLVSDNDMVIGSDMDNNGKTANFRMSGIASHVISKLTPSTGIAGNSILNGDYYNIPDTYNYFVWVDDYLIDSVRYQGYISDTVSLAPADAIYNRIDAIVVNSNGTITVITGTPSDNENLAPPSIDLKTQVAYFYVTVGLNSTSPNDIVTTPVYDENLQVAGGEFDTQAVGNVDLNNTDEFQSGTKSIFFSGQGTSIFTNDVTIGQAKLFNLIFRIKLANTVAHKVLVAIGNTVSGTGNSGASQAADRLTDIVSIDNGRFGFDASNTEDWQTIIIPFSAFENSLPFDKIWINNSESTSQFYIDSIFVQDGLALTSGNTITRTSQLINDGANGTNPFITAEDLGDLGAVPNEVKIDGAFVITEGKVNLAAFEVNDKFRTWIGDRYLVGKIISLPVTLPNDIDNPTKVKLASDNEI